jgi:hypothetical protein
MRQGQQANALKYLQTGVEEQATLRKALATNKPFPEMNDAKTRLAANKGVS